MAITGQTRIFALIGHPVAQARSPALFNRLFEQAGRDAVCVAFDVPDGSLSSAFAGIKATANIDVVFVTTPHKRAIVPLLDELSPTARTLGAVSIARREADGRWRGAIFDGVGCVAGLRPEGHDVRDKGVLLVGCGGAGRAVGLAVTRGGARALTLVDIDRNRADDLAELLQANCPACALMVGNNASSAHDIFINATTLGMENGDPSAFPARWLTPRSVIVDLLAEPDASATGPVARQVGCRAYGGRLVHEGQAVFAARFVGLDYWPDARPRVAVDDLFEA